MNDTATLDLKRPSAKWLEGIDPNEPFSAAAALALSARLNYVAAILPRTALAAEEDPEFVHQLRVASRRASAALDAFASCVPRRKGQKLRRKLRSIRRAAGAARDLDVLLSRLADARHLDREALSPVMDHLVRERDAAQQPIVALAKRLPEKKSTRRIARFVQRIRWRPDEREPTIYEAGRQQMHEVVQAFHAAGQGISGDAPVEQLHSLRIAGKRLRYTIELFACVAEDSLRQAVYPQMEELQERLGAINDHAAAERLLRDFAHRNDSPALRGKLNRLANDELQAVGPAAEAFHRWWNAGRLAAIHSATLSAFPPRPAA